MADFASIFVKNFKNGEKGSNWIGLQDDYTLNVGKSGVTNYVMCLRFEISKPMKSITLNFNNAYDVGKLPTFNYKFTTAEDSSLENAKADTSGEGTITANNKVQYGTNVFVIEKTLPAGTHYLYIWTAVWDNNSNTYNYLGVRFYGGNYGSSAFYEEMLSLVYIANGSEVVAYEAYIDNGTGWDLFGANEDNGTSWDTC